MPTNLPPDFYDVEKRYRLAKSPAEKIACLEEMLSIIPKHKGRLPQADLQAENCLANSKRRQHPCFSFPHRSGRSRTGRRVGDNQCG